MRRANPTRRRLTRRHLTRLTLALLLSAGCGGGGDDDQGGGPGTTGDTSRGKLAAEVAGYDIAVGPPARFIVGVFNPEKGPLGYGTVGFKFSFLGATKAEGQPQPGPETTAGYIPLPGSPPPPAGADRPVFLPATERGVYGAEVAFDKPGIWQIDVTADVDGSQTVSDVFTVLAQHEVPFPGEPAIPSQNLTLGTPGAPPAAIDSRATAERAVPDAPLHQTTVADALRRRRPVLLTISTPTFCVSQFCGPVTDMVADLEKEYGDRATFIHVEVWKDFQAQELNDAAKEWIARGENVNEPWLFLIESDGTIAARWDNVASRTEIEPRLKELPVLAG